MKYYNLLPSGRASKRRIRSSQVRFLTGTQNFSWVDDGGPGRPNLWGVQIRWDTGKSLPRLHGCVINELIASFFPKEKKHCRAFTSAFQALIIKYAVTNRQNTNTKGKLLIEKVHFYSPGIHFFIICYFTSCVQLLLPWHVQVEK